jgi:AcrR family transcriptional regulator
MPRQRSDAPANRLQLLETARRVFAEQGLAAEVKDIAAAAGVGIGTFYRNFPRKEDLVLAILEEADVAMVDAFEQADREGESGVERLRLSLVRLFEAEIRYGWLIDAMWTGQLPKEWLERADDERKGELFQSFLQQGIEEGALRPDIDTRLVTAMLMGPVLFRGRIGLDLEPEDAADALLRLVLDGAGQRE